MENDKFERVIVENVSKRFRIGACRSKGVLERFVSIFSGREHQKEIFALKNVSFNVKSGEILGIIGKNGSGKSTLLRVIAGIYKSDSGYVNTNGKIISLINLGFGFQWRLTMRDNIFLCCSLFDVGTEDIKNKFDSIVKFAGLEEFVDTKLYQFSNGMLQRLAFSIAIHCRPEILILDEVFEVGDEEFREKSSRKIIDIAKNGGSVIYVSHDMGMIKRYCDRVILMVDGKIAFEGKPNIAINKMLIKTR